MCNIRHSKQNCCTKVIKSHGPPVLFVPDDEVLVAVEKPSPLDGGLGSV